MYLRGFQESRHNGEELPLSQTKPVKDCNLKALAGVLFSTLLPRLESKR